MIEDPIYEQGKTTDWYTPPYILDLVRNVFHPKAIELDPCSCAMADSFVNAKKYYTKEENALQQDWVAKTVFLNPPYGKQVGEFIKHLIFSLEMKTVDEAILLINSNTSTGYWQHAYKHSTAISFPDHRIAFIDEYGNVQKSPRYSNSIFYFGKSYSRFYMLFSTIGAVALT